MNKTEKKKRLILLGSMVTLLSTACVKNEEFETVVKDIKIEKTTDNIVNAKELEKTECAIVVNNANIYLGPSEKYIVVSKVSKNDNVILEALSLEGWFLVNYNGVYGFIKGENLDLTNTILPTEFTTTVKLEEKKYVEATSDVNIREESSTNSKKLGLLKIGDKLELREKLNGWYKVIYNEKVAYVYEDYVKEILSADEEKHPNKCYKFICLKEDSQIVSQNDYNNYKMLPKYECAKVFNESKGYYLAESEGFTGYISKENTIDLLDEFVIVDISDQQLNLYKDTDVVFTSDVVTGKDKSPTDLGIEEVIYKQKDRTLVGANNSYRTHVDYWMQINDNAEGLHDAKWRSNFGGNIYKNSGSHGCVNLPHESAAYLFDELEVGTKVIVKK
ncbi:MAG: hypothetical protein E7158_06775 [Firmicutes bacterium]|nr:hypothetical protein [Bacillota bacterium]